MDSTAKDCLLLYTVASAWHHLGAAIARKFLALPESRAGQTECLQD